MMASICREPPDAPAQPCHNRPHGHRPMSVRVEQRGDIIGMYVGAVSGGIVGFGLGVLVGAWFW